MKVEIIGYTPNPERLIETAGRACYNSKKNDPERFIRARLKEGHESIIEHASITFDIDGISRACSHQLVRHRIASFSQQSQRYVSMDNPEFVIPPGANSEDALQVWDNAMATAVWSYNKLRELGWRKEDARFVLPNATATRIVVTMNFRSLRHFFEVRCDKAAQWEIRQLALVMLKKSFEIAPSVFEDLYNEYF